MDVVSGRKAVKPAPIWLMRQAGRYLPEYRNLRQKTDGFLDFCLRPDMAAEATLQPIRRFGFDAAILFADILLIPHGLGQKVRFVEGEGPLLEPVSASEEFGPDPFRKCLHALEPVMETVARVRQALPKEVALIGFAGAPWTVATYVVGGRGSPDQAAARLLAYRDPEAMSGILHTITLATIEYLSGQIQSGADAVKLFDSWAQGFGSEDFARWVIAPTRAIVESLRRRHPETPIIGFPRGCGHFYERYRRETGVDVLALDNGVPVEEAQRLQKAGPVQGLLDPLALIAGGPGLDRSIDGILGALGSGPFVFNLGHGIRPETPIAHVEQLVARVRRSTR